MDLNLWLQWLNVLFPKLRWYRPIGLIDDQFMRTVNEYCPLKDTCKAFSNWQKSQWLKVRHSHSSRPEIVISGTIKMRSTRFDINIFITSSRLQSHTRIFFSVTGRPTLTAHAILFSGELLMSQRYSPRWLVYTLWKWLKIKFIFFFWLLIGQLFLLIAVYSIKYAKQPHGAIYVIPAT